MGASAVGAFTCTKPGFKKRKASAAQKSCDKVASDNKISKAVFISYQTTNGNAFKCAHFGSGDDYCMK